MTVSPEERDRRIEGAVLADLLHGDDPDAPLWYLSFVDTEILATIPENEQRPGGPSWLGACIVPAIDAASAAAASHRLGCNPGGQVAIHGPIERAAVKPDYIGRLLTLDEIEAAGA